MLFLWCLLSQLLYFLNKARDRNEASTILVTVVYKFLDFIVLQVGYFSLFKNFNNLLSSKNLVLTDVLDFQSVIKVNFSVENLTRSFPAILKLLLGDIASQLINLAVLSSMLVRQNASRILPRTEIPLELFE